LLLRLRINERMQISKPCSGPVSGNTLTVPVPRLPCRASGAMDNASDYGSEDSRFDSWLVRRHVLTVCWEDLYALLWPSVLSLGSTFAADFGGPWCGLSSRATKSW